ncbi:MAG: hypothetical protein KatS3mg094_327 [Candidatus Parcubacteria bacterium]|nr:MAG: hypothetical protein KatS3mg094_327 [Candidatus Parcubacteria bacterium]
MTVSFSHNYINSPTNVRNFIYSNEYYDYLEEYLKKFEINENKEIDFIYLLQDLIFKVFEPKSIMELKDEIIKRLSLNENDANQMAYILFSQFIPKINILWQKEKETKEIKSSPPEIANLLKRIQEIKAKTKPGKILNLQKVIPPRKEKENIVSAINIQKPDEVKTIKIEIPKLKTEGLESSNKESIKKLFKESIDELGKDKDEEKLTFNIPQLKEEGLKTNTQSSKEEMEKLKKESEDKSSIIIIKQQKKSPPEEGIIDLSQY